MAALFLLGNKSLHAKPICEPPNNRCSRIGHQAIRPGAGQETFLVKWGNAVSRGAFP